MEKINCKVFISGNMVIPGSDFSFHSSNMEPENCPDQKLNSKSMGFSELFSILEINCILSDNFCVETRKSLETLINCC